MFSLLFDFKDYIRIKRLKFCSNLKMCLLNILFLVENQLSRQFCMEVFLSNSEKVWNVIFLFFVKRQCNLKNIYCDFMCLVFFCIFFLKICLLMMFFKELVGLFIKVFFFKNFIFLGELLQILFFGILIIIYF